MVLQLFICSLALSLAASTPPVFAQSQASNGQIEGTVQDQTGAAVKGVVITATNIETGASRSVSTDENGVYRFPLLPLGSYRLTAEAARFKRFLWEDILLATGQTATVNLNLEAGEVDETVTVSSDAPVADAGKTDLGRVLNSREVQNLPLITRNPYNFGLLQANANGRINRGFGFLNINVNGYLRRIYYLLDGNTNQQGETGSSRLMILSDTYVKEIQIVTNGFAAEFGNTPGMIMNFVTPSGTNKTSVALAYRFRRPKFYSRPFFFPAEDLPESRADNLTATVGGALISGRWHYYAAYEYLKNNDNSIAARVSTIRPEDRAWLIREGGLSPSIFPPSIPNTETHHFYIFRTDVQLNERNRLTGRFNHHDPFVRNFIAGGINTLERSQDSKPVDHGFAGQLASFTPRVLNEFRFQYAQRADALSCRNELSGTGPSVSITEVANFGSPICPASRLVRITQFQDNLTRTTGAHVVKFGGGFNFYNSVSRARIFSSYTFPRIDAYIAARNGKNPRSYTRYEETFGDPELAYRATFWNFFVQDDWKLTRRLKINYGLRYDLYLIPKADPTSPFPASRKFNVDKTNFAPRLGIVYALREGTRPTILRLGAGIYYDQPLLLMYVRALRDNGNSRFFSFRFLPGDNVAPNFPNTFSGSLPPNTSLTGQNIDAIAPDFVNMYAIHSHVQLEQALTENLSLAVGYVHSGGRHLPVYRNINCLPTGGTLADGRPLFGPPGLPVRSCVNRRFPQFGNIQMVEAAGVSRYDALTLQLTKRFSRGWQLSAHYTLSKAIDDAPEQNMTTEGIQGLVLSDPTNRALDKGYSFADQRHTFVMSLVARPQFNFSNNGLRKLFNHNQFAVIAGANSGETFNIITAQNLDLNRDGIATSDRPAGIRRNAGKTPPQYNVDLRYSRFFNLTERYRLEIFGELQNLFNINSIVGYNTVSVPANPITGVLLGELPDFKARNQSTAQESRQLQLGLKFIF